VRSPALDRPGSSWDRSTVSEPGDDDDGEPVRRRDFVPPPPDEGPDSVHFPRMEPPPASLEAMVQSRNRAPQPEAPGSWWVWVVLALAAAVITGYVMR